MSLSINSAIGAGAGSVSTGGQPRTGISGLDKLMAEPSSISLTEMSKARSTPSKKTRRLKRLPKSMVRHGND